MKNLEIKVTNNNYPERSARMNNNIYRNLTGNNYCVVIQGVVTQDDGWMKVVTLTPTERCPDCGGELCIAKDIGDLNQPCYVSDPFHPKGGCGSVFKCVEHGVHISICRARVQLAHPKDMPMNAEYRATAERLRRMGWYPAQNLDKQVIWAQGPELFWPGLGRKDGELVLYVGKDTNWVKVVKHYGKGYVVDRCVDLDEAMGVLTNSLRNPPSALEEDDEDDFPF